MTEVKIPESLPWVSQKNSLQYTSIYDGTGKAIATLDIDDWGVDDDNQDALELEQADVAAYIVHACNAYPALVEALMAQEEASAFAAAASGAIEDGSAAPKYVMDRAGSLFARAHRLRSAALKAAGVET